MIIYMRHLTRPYLGDVFGKVETIHAVHSAFFPIYLQGVHERKLFCIFVKPVIHTVSKVSFAC